VTTTDRLSSFVPPPPGETRCVQRGTAVIEYFSRGSGSTVVLIGMLKPVWHFDPLIARLNDAGRRTLTVHLPGIGQSRRRFRPRPTLWDFADDLQAVLADAGVPSDERVDVVGMAIGNRVARAFATRHAARTDRLVLLAAGGKGRGWPPLRMIVGYALLMLPGLPLRARRAILEPLWSARRNVLPDEYCHRPPRRATLVLSAAVRRTDSRLWWAGGAGPMLVVQGERDIVANPQHARDLKQEFPDRVQLEMIPNGGHALLYDCPDVVIGHVMTFLQSQRERG